MNATTFKLFYSWPLLVYQQKMHWQLFNWLTITWYLQNLTVKLQQAKHASSLASQNISTFFFVWQMLTLNKICIICAGLLKTYFLSTFFCYSFRHRRLCSTFSMNDPSTRRPNNQLLNNALNDHLPGWVSFLVPLVHEGLQDVGHPWVVVPLEASILAPLDPFWENSSCLVDEDQVLAHHVLAHHVLVHHGPFHLDLEVPGDKNKLSFNNFTDWSPKATNIFNFLLFSLCHSDHEEKMCPLGNYTKY